MYKGVIFLAKKYCENCGAACKDTDSFCRMCNASLAYAADESYKLINDISTSELNMLIDKNAARYMEILADNEDKKVFIHFNWAAFFIPEIWLLYRKMYLYFVLKIISTILILGLVLWGTIAYCSARVEDEKNNPPQQVQPNYENLENLSEELRSKYINDFNKAAQYQIPFSKQAPGLVLFAFGFTVLLVNFVFSLFADCLYRRYLIKHYEYYCGVSVLSALWGVLVFGIFIVIYLVYMFQSNFEGIFFGILNSYF